MSSTDNKKRKKVQIKVPQTENIIFIGSEMHYDSFWLKMMFVAAAYAKIKDLHYAKKTTVGYVDNGYTRAEKLSIDNLHEQYGFEIVKIASSADIVNLLNRNRDDVKLQDVAFFSHGVVGKIALDYAGEDDVDFGIKNFSSVRKDAFMSTGRIYSYACRTGVSIDDLTFGFKSEVDAHPEDSLAQKMANHFDIEVHAFLRRSHYGEVIRIRSESATISSTLKTARATQEGAVIDIPPEHEALPHPGLASSWNPLSSAKREGTVDYALWRKRGGLSLPVAGDSPSGLPTEMRVFTASKK